MGALQQFTDVTGNMSPLEINAQNITNVIQEFNRAQDLLDALNTTPKIISRGTATINWDGTNNQFPVVSATIGSSTQFTFLAYYTRSDLPNNLYPISDYSIDTSGNIVYYMIAFTEGNNIFFALG